MHSRDLACARPWALFVPLLLSLSCGGGDSGTPTPNPVPTISAISRDTATAGVTPFNVTLSGSDFLSGVVGSFDGAPRTTDRGGSGSITIHLTAADLATVGDHEIRVKNPDPEGGPTAPIPFHVLAQPPVPVLDSLSPDTVVANTLGTLDLKAFGHGFVSGAVLRMNGNPVTTTRVSDTLLTTTILGGILGTPGSVTLTVFKQGPGGGTSVGRAFTVIPHPPVPIVSSTVPSQVFIAADTMLFVLRGTGLAGTDTVVFTNLADTRTVTPASVTDTAVIVPLDRTWLQSSAGLYMTVHTPGGTSSPFGVDVRDPIPTISSVTPDTLEGGQVKDTLIVTGTGFVPGMAVWVNGGPVLATQVLGFTTIRAIVDENTLLLGGIRSLLVYDDNEGWGSNAIDVGIRSPAPTLDSIAGDPTDTVGSTAERVIWGTGFRANGEVLVNGVPHTPLSIGSNAALFALTAEDTDSSGTLNIAYRTPQPGGGTTTTLPLTIVAANPTPTVDSLSSDHLVDGADRAITLIGHGFLPGAQATIGDNFGYLTLPATVADSEHLMVIIPDSLLNAGARLNIGGRNPQPTPGPSTWTSVDVWSTGIRSSHTYFYGTTSDILGDAPRGVAYVTSGNTLQAFDPATGTIVRSIDLPSPISHMVFTGDSSSLWLGVALGLRQGYRVDLDAWTVTDSLSIPGTIGGMTEILPLPSGDLAVEYAVQGGFTIVKVVNGVVASEIDSISAPIRLVGLRGSDTLLAASRGIPDSLYRLLVDSSGIHRLSAFEIANTDPRPQILGDRLLVGGSLMDIGSGAYIGSLPVGWGFGVPDPMHGRFLVVHHDEFNPDRTELYDWSTEGQVTGVVERFPAFNAAGPGTTYGTDGLIFVSTPGVIMYVRADNIEN